MKSRTKHLVVAACIIAFYLVVWVYLDVQKYFTFEALKQHQEWLLGSVEEHYLLSVVAYLVTATLHGACALPATSLLIMLSGFLFGWVAGMLYALMGMFFGGCCAFFITRSLFGYALYRKYQHQLEQFRAKLAEQYVTYLLMIRFIPVIPFCMANVLSGLALVPTTIFIWTLLVGIAPSVLIYASLGTEMGSLNHVGDLFSWRIMLLFGALVLLTIVPIIRARWKK